jgi:hypothetical protein
MEASEGLRFRFWPNIPPCFTDFCRLLAARLPHTVNQRWRSTASRTRLADLFGSAPAEVSQEQ